MVGLHIVAVMDEPVAYQGDGLHLDGPIARGAFLALTPRERDALPPIADPWALDFPLPLERWHADYPGECRDELRAADGRVWGWCCSAVHADWLGQSIRHVNKVLNHGAMARFTSSPSVNTAGGQFKQQRLPYGERIARELHWYAVGDEAGVREHLDRVPAVGKLVNMGSGRVRRWVVERCDDATELWRARVMPSPTGRGIEAGIRAPYYHPSRRVRCEAVDYGALAPC